MPYNPKKNGAANYKSWMQLTSEQIAALQSIEGEDNTSDPNAEQFAQVVHVAGGDLSGGGAVTIADGPNLDAFQRMRVSNPETLFDSKNIFKDPDIPVTEENSPLFYDNQETSGSGTSTSYQTNQASQTLTVSNTTAGTRVRQTKMRFNYQPGKSQLILMTFNMQGQVPGVTKREGMFDENNGLFIEVTGDEIAAVVRSSTSGSPVDIRIPQSEWNIDKFDGTGPSGKNLETNKTQILLIDFEWLGVGRVRFGTVIDGQIFYAHHVNNANNLDVVYMSTPNLPLRSEITNDGTGTEASITQICASVISEGGSQKLGVTRFEGLKPNLGTGDDSAEVSLTNTLYGVIGIKLKPNYLGASVDISNIQLQLTSSSVYMEWFLILNPVYEDAEPFVFNDVSQSAVQFAQAVAGGTCPEVSGGYVLAGGYLEAGRANIGPAFSEQFNITSALRLGAKIDGSPDEMVVVVRAASGINLIRGGISWQELV
jgi:hypothetical protein